jgi:hypothetical protein
MVRQDVIAVGRISLLALCILSSCALFQRGALSPKEGDDKSQAYAGFEPIDPLPVDYLTRSTIQDTTERVPWPEQAGDVRLLLPNQSSSTAIRKISGDGKITYLTSAVTTESASYEVIWDYAKYRVEPVYETTSLEKWGSGSDKLVGFGKIGVGVRIRAYIQSNTSGADLNGLLAISAAAKVNAISGHLEVDIYGIDSKGVNSLLPIGLKLEESSLQSALQQLATMQTRIYDDTGLTLTPHLLAIRRAAPTSGPIDESHDKTRIDVMQAITGPATNISAVAEGPGNSIAVNVTGGAQYALEVSKSHDDTQWILVYDRDPTGANSQPLIRVQANREMRTHNLAVPKATGRIFVVARYGAKEAPNKRVSWGPFPDNKDEVFASMAWDPPHANANIRLVHPDAPPKSQ